jgi:hypothetical protein
MGMAGQGGEPEPVAAGPAANDPIGDVMRLIDGGAPGQPGTHPNPPAATEN